MPSAATPRSSRMGKATKTCRRRSTSSKLLRRMEPSDVLVVTRLGRLARSTRDLLNILDAIAEAEASLVAG